MKTITLPRATFLKDLETCLTLKAKIKSNLFECEYTSPSLHTKIVHITTF